MNLQEFIEKNIEETKFSQSIPDPTQVTKEEQELIQKKTPPLSPELMSAMEAANTAFQASDIGKLLADKALEMSPSQVSATISEVSNIPEIQELAKIANGPDIFTAETLGDGTIIKEIIEEYAPQSILIQFCATAEIIAAGGTVYIGFALNISDTNQSSLYVGGSIGVGAGVITAAGQGVGITSNTYANMTGACVGIDGGGANVLGLLFDASIGVSLPDLHIIPSSWTVVAYLLEGEGGGAEVYGGFTLKLFDQSLPNIYQPSAAYSVNVYSIECIKRKDTSGHDEIYIEVELESQQSQTFRYPLWDHYSIEQGETWDVGFSINFNSNFKLTLYESDDIIHSWTVNNGGIPAPGGTSILNFSQDGTFTNDIDYNITIQNPASV